MYQTLGNWNPVHVVQNGAGALENNVVVPQKSKLELIHDPMIALLGIYAEVKIGCRHSCSQEHYSQ